MCGKRRRKVKYTSEYWSNPEFLSKAEDQIILIRWEYMKWRPSLLYRCTHRQQRSLTHTHTQNIQNMNGNKKVGLRLILVKYLHIYIYIYDDNIICNHGNTINKLVSNFFLEHFLGGKFQKRTASGENTVKMPYGWMQFKNSNCTTKN